jgi:hypothetical protein
MSGATNVFGGGGLVHFTDRQQIQPDQDWRSKERATLELMLGRKIVKSSIVITTAASTI